MAPAAIELIGINKSFGAVHANRDINLEIARGTIHGIVGENGAGKSTLMSILTDSTRPTAARSARRKPRLFRTRTTPSPRIAGAPAFHGLENFHRLENFILGAEGSRC